MGMREKLIELLRGATKTLEEQKERWILGGKAGERPGIFSCFADHLIANGVTIPVRCKGCRHYDFGVCLKIYSDGAVSQYAWQARNENDFCSYGERRSDERTD